MQKLQQGVTMIIVNGYIVVGSVDHSLRMIDSDTGQVIRVWEHYGQDSNHMGLTPAGHMVICPQVERNPTMWLVDPAGPLLHATTLPGHRVGTMTVLPNGNIALGHNFGTESLIRILNPMTGALLREFPTLRFASGILALPNGHLVLSTADTLQIFNPETGEHLLNAPSLGSVAQMLILADGNIAVCSDREDGTVRIFNPETGALARPAFQQLGRVSSMAVLPNGHLVTSALGVIDTASIRIFNPETGTLVAEIHPNCSVWSLQTLPNSNIVVYSIDNIIRVFNSVNGAPLRTINIPVGHRPIEMPPHFAHPLHTIAPQVADRYAGLRDDLSISSASTHSRGSAHSSSPSLDSTEEAPGDMGRHEATAASPSVDHTEEVDHPMDEEQDTGAIEEPSSNPTQRQRRNTI